MTTLVELCAGTASVSLWALGRCAPLTGYMGSKRRWAPLLVEALGVDRPDRVVLVDAGPWGDTWSVLRTAEGRDAVRFELHEMDAWVDGGGADALWERCLAPPVPNHGVRVARFLWLQARSAGTIPVWWSGERWESPTGARTEAAHNRGGGDARRRQKGAASRSERGGRPAQKGAAPPIESSRKVGGVHQKDGVLGLNRTAFHGRNGCRGIQHPRTIAQRIAALRAIDWERVEVVHGDVRGASIGQLISDLGSAATVYVDPPYVGCPRYAALLPRADLLECAAWWLLAGARVAISEAEPLPLRGWTSRRLPRRLPSAKPEWVTASWPIAIEEQQSLFAVPA